MPPAACPKLVATTTKATALTRDVSHLRSDLLTDAVSLHFGNICSLISIRVKRPSGMSSLLGKIGSKKQKMSTLEKSKLDWENFKEEEGIVEELAIHNRGKDG